jgi:O-antigen/teichoic acid export membrane protein
VKSYREIFRSSAIIGGSSIVNIGIGIIRVKIVALLLGPAGIGLFGIYGSIVGLGTIVAGCGLSNSAVRQLALSTDDPQSRTSARRVLLFANLALGCLAMLVTWSLRDAIAQTVFEGAISESDVGWLGLAMLLSLIASSQTTLLQGLRRIGDLARVNIISAAAGSTLGVSIVYVLGQSGVVWMLVVAPAASILVAIRYTQRLSMVPQKFEWKQSLCQCHAMLRFGIPVMIGGLMNIGAEFLVRALIIRDLGIESAGYFQSSWAISMTYLGFVLGAMATDYYPRLTEAYRSRERTRQLVNEQVEMTLLIGGPLILGMITFAPLAIYALYSPEFSPAAEILRWQMLGSIVKLIGWPMGFVVLASGRSILFIYTQFVWNAIYLLLLYLFLESAGLLITGIAFAIAYLVSVFNIWFVVNKLIGFVPTIFNIGSVIALLISGSLIIYAQSFSVNFSYSLGLLLTLTIGVFSLRRIDRLVDLSGWFGKLRS